jgi:hypothetical protein
MRKAFPQANFDFSRPTLRKAQISTALVPSWVEIDDLMLEPGTVIPWSSIANCFYSNSFLIKHPSNMGFLGS